MLSQRMKQGRQNTKHHAIYLKLKESLDSGVYSPGDRLPPESDLSAHFGVSRPTVMRALNSLRDAGLIVRRAGSGSYVADRSQDNPTTSFGILVTGLGTGKLSERVSASIAEHASIKGFSLLWNTTDHATALSSPENPVPWETRLRRICEQFERQKVSGVFFEPLELEPNASEINAMVLSLLDNAGIAVVLLDSDVVTFPERSSYDLVGMDNVHVGYRTTAYLLSRGYRRVDYFFRGGSASTVALRIKGYQLALLDAGLTPNADYLHMGEPTDPAFVKSCIDAGMKNIVCPNDVTAASLIHTLYDLGYSIPHDIRIIGVDDVKYAQLLRIPLTTYCQPSKAIGIAAVEIMLSRMQNPDLEPRTVSFTGDVIVRQSS